MIYLYLFGTCFHFIYVFMIIGNKYIPIPPKDEIKGFTKLNEVNELIYAFEDNVNALKEYKKHLISDIITGKIKV